MKKTNAMRILDAKKIHYAVKEYDDDGEHELKKGAALSTSQKIGVEPERVFKTIVMQTESKETVVFCQNALYEINLKKARNVCGAKEIFPVRQDELLSLTGYVRGGCSPVGMKRKFRTFIDETVLLHETVFVSGGARGIQIEISPEDLISASDATVADLILE
jgi:Cys-tRNA(Pro)/Cys-tRNA(Cys) deacylase